MKETHIASDSVRVSFILCVSDAYIQDNPVREEAKEQSVKRKGSIEGTFGRIDVVVAGWGKLDRGMSGNDFALLIDHVQSAAITAAVDFIGPTLAEILERDSSSEVQISHDGARSTTWSGTTIKVEFKLHGFAGVGLREANEVLGAALDAVQKCVVHILDDPTGEQSKKQSSDSLSSFLEDMFTKVTDPSFLDILNNGSVSDRDGMPPFGNLFAT